MSVQFVDNETPAGVIDGVNDTFTLEHAPNPSSSLELYLNGLRLASGVDYSLSNEVIVFVSPPGAELADTPFLASYRYNATEVVLSTPSAIIGSDLKIMAESILDGVTIPDVLFYQLLNTAKNKLEAKRFWQYLKKLDDSNTGVTGGSYQLPDDFAHDYKVIVGSTEYLPVPFEEHSLYSSQSNRYYIDFAGEKYYLLGNVKPGKIYFYYKKTTDNITESTTPLFPARFHPILAFYVAAYYQNGVEYDDIWAKMSPENKMAAMELEDAMTLWDAQLSARSQDNRIGVAGSEPTVDLSMM